MIYSVVVTYNGREWLDKCIYSLINSSISTRVIVVDNSSTDGTQDILRQKYPQVELIETHHNLGFGKANNIGLKKAYEAGADYVFLLNQDAWVEPNTLEKLINAAKRFPEYGIISPVHLNGNGDQLDFNFSYFIAPQNCPNLYSDMWTSRLENRVYKAAFVNAAAWLISQKTLETVGGFSPLFFHYSEDDNYIHRLRYHGLEIGVFPLTNIHHDRENRPLSKQFTDPLESELRTLMIRYANPEENSNINNLITQLYKGILKNFLLFRWSQIQYLFKLLREIKKIATEIERTKEISQTSGPSFL